MDVRQCASRRNFLRAAVGATALMLPPFAPRLFAAETPSKQQLGWALVGLGRLSTNQLAPALQKTKHAKLVAVVTGTPEKERIWGEKYAIPKSHIYNYETLDKIAENDDIDVINVVLPNSMHCEYTVRGAKAGKHVFSEKPMAVSSDECRQMIDACRAAKRKLGVGYRCQFEPHHLECIRLARERAFGKLHQIDAGFGFRIEDFPPDDPKHWRLEKKLAGGGALMDVGIYAMNACRYITGEEPATIGAAEVKTDPRKFAEVDETVVWNMTFPSGVVATCSTTYNYNGVNKYTAYADRGSFGLEPAYSYGGIRGIANGKPIEAPEIDQFAAEIDDFATCIKEDRPTKVPGEEGLKDLIALEAVYRSIREGSRVDVSGNVKK
jgi:predicted dehydrogenase